MDFKEFLELHVNIGSHKLTVAHLLLALLILVVAKLLVWALHNVVLERFFKGRRIDPGRQAALRQFLSYIVWVMAVLAILEAFGVSSMVWASSAALLVGIGLGLQDSFKDLVSGIIILVEGTVEVGDIIEVEGIVARAVKIGLRTSKFETRDRVSILIPNSQLVNSKVTNWTHDDQPARFALRIGVAYRSDVGLVVRLLRQAAESHTQVLKDPPVTVQFKDFGDSALLFDLLFFTQEFFNTDTVKSDIRYAIEQLFRENGIEVPFPQRDVWIRNPEDLK